MAACVACHSRMEAAVTSKSLSCKLTDLYGLLRRSLLMVAMAQDLMNRWSRERPAKWVHAARVRCVQPGKTAMYTMHCMAHTSLNALACALRRAIPCNKNLVPSMMWQAFPTAMI